MKYVTKKGDPKLVLLKVIRCQCPLRLAEKDTSRIVIGGSKKMLTSPAEDV
jgi:hypothetical protein